MNGRLQQSLEKVSSSKVSKVLVVLSNNQLEWVDFAELEEYFDLPHEYIKSGLICWFDESEELEQCQIALHVFSLFSEVEDLLESQLEDAQLFLQKRVRQTFS